MEPTEADIRDQFGRRLEDKGAWRQAITLEAAGELTARWLEGHSEYQAATFTVRYDDETEPIAVELAALNRNGLFTKESQPGLRTEDLAQRQYVTAILQRRSGRRPARPVHPHRTGDGGARPR